MIASLILGIDESFPEVKGDVVGVDRGAFFCSQIQVQMKYAIGDFDSVNEQELHMIEQYAEEIIKLPSHKDDTDSEYALNFLLKKGYTEFRIYGGLGSRMDHSLVNLLLLAKYDATIVLYGENNKIQYLKKGTHIIKKEGYAYLSLLCFEPTLLTIKSVAYPLIDRQLQVYDTYAVSNEIMDEECTLTIQDGALFLIQCNDKQLI